MIYILYAFTLLGFLLVLACLYTKEWEHVILVSLVLGAVWGAKYLIELPPDASCTERIKANKVPRIIREFDSCKVWTFMSDEGRWVYVTKCGQETTTESSYKTGKHSSQTDSITTK